MEDHKIIEGCRLGKDAAFKALVLRYSSTLLGVCMRYLRNRNDAEDALQDSFIVDEMNAKEILLMLDQLPEAHRLVFNLHVIEGYSHIEIGKILNIPESSSRVYLLRARQRLQEMTNTYSLKIVNK